MRQATLDQLDRVTCDGGMASWCLAHTAETQDEHARATLTSSTT